MGAKRPAPQLQVAARGEPAGRLLQLISETNLPQPYVISDDIAIRPLTKSIREKLNEVRNKRMVANFMLSAAMGQEGTTDNDITQLTTIANDCDDEYHRLFFGDQHDAVMEFFADRDPALWDAFCNDIQRQFLPGPAPATGQCPHCGNIIDAETAGKGPESST